MAVLMAKNLTGMLLENSPNHLSFYSNFLITRVENQYCTQS